MRQFNTKRHESESAMKLILLFVSLCLVATFSAKPTRDEQWKNYQVCLHSNVLTIFAKVSFIQKRHGKKNNGNAIRRRKWEKNIQLVEKHNNEADNGLHTFKITDNHLADLVCLGSNLT